MTKLDTLIFDPSPCGFPSPRIPLLPVGLQGIALHADKAWAPSAHFRHFSRGRYALREACHLAGIGTGTALLAPAYHCRTMLDPALALGGQVVLYPLQPDLSPDMAALDAVAANSPTPIRAMIATHFFGIPKSLARLAEWCATRNICLIEDCAHAFFTEQHCPPGIGKYGQYVVSSPYKFLSSPDGGLLYSPQAERLKEVHPHAPPWDAEPHGMANALSKAWTHRHPANEFDISRIDSELAAIRTVSYGLARDSRVTAGHSADYHPDMEQRGPLRISRWMYRHAAIDVVAARRRENYARWAVATMNQPNSRPLHAELPKDCIPYMFPLIIDRPDTHFYWLKHLGMPIWRWDSIAASDCPTANRYRLHLLHLPCHQSLTKNELDWMIAAITKVSSGETAGKPR